MPSAPPHPAKAAAVDRFVAWTRAEALPTWAERGFDRTAGRFHERLDAAGEPIAVPHRAMVQARQIYVYAHAGLLGWDDRGPERAARAMASLQRDFCAEEGDGVAVRFSIDATSGALHSSLLDAYTYAFVLFASGFLYRAIGDAAILRFAEKVARFVEHALTDRAHGGLLTQVGAEDAEKLQNPQMHLLEAWLSLAEADPGGAWLDRARTLVALFTNRMVGQVAPSILPERFAPDWGPHPDSSVADVFEPGHHFEWIWLLDWYDRLTGEATGPIRAALLATATQPTAAKGPLIHDQMGGDGRIVRDSHRLWPHCEAIKAAVATAPGLADATGRALADGAAGALVDHFLGRPFAGGWTDQIDPGRQPLVDYVPASSLYHLVLAASVADEATRSHS